VNEVDNGRGGTRANVRAHTLPEFLLVSPFLLLCIGGISPCFHFIFILFCIRSRKRHWRVYAV